MNIFSAEETTVVYILAGGKLVVEDFGVEELGKELPDKLRTVDNMGFLFHLYSHQPKICKTISFIFQTQPKVLCKPHYCNSHLETEVCKWEASHSEVV